MKTIIIILCLISSLFTQTNEMKLKLEMDSREKTVIYYIPKEVKQEKASTFIAVFLTGAACGVILRTVFMLFPRNDLSK